MWPLLAVRMIPRMDTAWGMRDSGTQLRKSTDSVPGTPFFELFLLLQTSRSGRNIGDSMLKQGFTLAVNIRVDSTTLGGWGRELANAAEAVEAMEVPWGSGSPMNTPLPSCLPPASSMCDGTSYEHWAESVENALAQVGHGHWQMMVQLIRESG